MSEISITLDMEATGLGMEALRESILFNVFDSRMNLVGQVRPNGPAISGLKPGAYKIAVDLPNGEEREKLVVLGEDPVIVPFDYEQSERSVEHLFKSVGAYSKPERILGHRAFSKTQAPIFSDQTPISISLPNVNDIAQLSSVTGAHAERRGPGHWEFFGESQGEVCFADFQTKEDRYGVALPISGGGASLTCSVHINPTIVSSRLEVRVEVASDRPLVRSMLNLVDSGKTYQAGQLADGARELLYHKFTDPIGATLGALTLFRLGRLDERPMADWVQNLFNNFGWITDAEILRVAMSSSLGEYHSEHFDTLLACAERPVVFTQAYSMMIKNLRSWGGHETKEQESRRRQALERLSKTNTLIDWSAPTIVIRGGSFS